MRGVQQITRTVRKMLPVEYRKYKKLSDFGKDIFLEEKLIEIKIGDETLFGKCFVDKTKRDMYWRPFHRCYVLLEKYTTAISYDLLKDCDAVLVATDIDIKNERNKRIEQIIKRGTYHLQKMQKAYDELQEV